MPQIMPKGFTDWRQNVSWRKAHMVPMAGPAKVQQDLLQSRNLGHAGAAEKVVRNGVVGEAALAQVKLQSAVGCQ